MQQIQRTIWLAISLILCTLFLGSSLTPAQATASNTNQDIAETPPFSLRTGWGLITWDETWGGTIHLKGDVTISSGFNLTIKPGTTITFDPIPDPNKEIIENGKYNLQVGGNLYASGNPRRPITFRNVEEPYYPINLYTRVLGNAVLKYFETGGIDDLHYDGTIDIYGDSTIFSSTFHGPGLGAGHTTFCSNTAEGGVNGTGFFWNNTTSAIGLGDFGTYPSHVAGNTFNIPDGGYGLITRIDPCDINYYSDSDSCRIIVENNFFNGGTEGIRLLPFTVAPNPPEWNYETIPAQIFIRNNRFEGQTYGIALHDDTSTPNLSGRSRIYLGDFYPGEDGLDDGGNSFINVNTLLYLRSVLYPWEYYPYDLKAENNYWGYATRAEIEAHMYDEDQVCGGSCDYVGDVDFIPFLKAEKRMVPPSEPCAVHGSPILLRTGDYTFQTTDLSLDSVGTDIEMVRTYHAQDGFDGPLGPGWSLSYFVQAVITQNGDQTQVIVRMDDGTRMVFHEQPNGSYQPAQAWDAELSENGGLYQLEMLTGETYTFNANGWLEQKADRAGNTHTVTYTPQGRASQILDAKSRGVTFTYSTGGKISQMQDHTGRSWTYSYDANGFLSQATNPAGQSFTYTYDSYGNLSGVFGPDSQQMQQMSYNPSDQATSFTESGWPVLTSYYPAANQATETDAGGNQTQYTYNDQGQRASETDPLGRTTQQTWDTAANNTGTTTPSGAQFTTAFDTNGYPRTHTDALNQTWETVYRTDGQLGNFTDRRGGTTTFGYDAQSNQTSITDRLSHITQYVYDSAGQLTQIISPEGRAITYQFDPQSGAVISSRDGLNREVAYAVDTLGRHVIYTDTLGNRTQFEYDSLDQITLETNPLNQTTSYEYDVYGNIAVITNTLGHAFAYESDAHGQLFTEVDPLGNTWFWDYDLRGNLASAIDAAGRVQFYNYDAAGQLIGVTNPLGAVYQLGYDVDGNLSSWEDPEGNLTTYGYDALSRMTVFTDTLGYITTYGYDPDGNPTQMQNALSHTTQYSYDAEGKLTGITNPATGVLAYTYHPDGMRKTRQDLDGSTTTFSYDAAGQLTQAVHSSGASLSLGYRAPGQVNQYVDGSGTVAIGYDALDRPTQVTDVFNNVVGVTYGANGQPQTVNLPGGLAVTYAYDNAEQLQSAQFNGVTLQFDLNPVGEVVTQTWTGGPSIVSEYNPLGQPTQRTVNRPNGTVLLQHTTTYDNMSRMMAFNNGSGQVDYTYDTNSQLTKAIHPTLGTVNYAYDGVGNRTSAGGVTASYDNLNRLTSATNGVSYTYDSNNRRDTRTGGIPHTYSYDHRHILTGVDFGDGTQSIYTYDGRGKLAQTTHRDGSISRYVYFGDRLVAITDGANAVQIYFVYGERADVPIAMVTGGQVYMLITDAAGTVHGLVDQSGNLVASYTYGPWGEVLAETGSVAQPLRFSGRIYDEDTQFALHGMRWYDPAAGVFLTPDPLVYELDGILMVNHFRYADGDPINRVDIGGLLGFASREFRDMSGRNYGISPQLSPRHQQKLYEFGKTTWAASKYIPIVGTFTSGIDAAWYYGKGIYNNDPVSLKKSGREIAGLVASLTIPGCKAGASLGLKALQHGISLAAGYLGNNLPEVIETIKEGLTNPGTHPPTPSGSPNLLYRGMIK